MSDNKWKLSIVIFFLFMLSACSTKSDDRVIFAEFHDSKCYVKEVELLNYNYQNPQVINNTLYICTSIGKQHKLTNLVEYNLNNGENKNIYSSRFQNPALQSCMINKDWIVWQDMDETGSNYLIKSMNYKTKEICTVYEYSGYMTLDTPYLYDNYVAWMHTEEGKNSEVYVYNLMTKELSKIYKINQPGFYNAFLSINDGKVLWTDCIDNQGYFFTYDLVTKSIDKYKSPYKYPGYSKMYKEMFFSINSNNITEWGKLGIYDYKKSSYKSFSIESIFRFTTYKNIIAVLTKKSTLEIYSINGDSIDKINLDIQYRDKTFDTIDFSYDGTLIAGRRYTIDTVSKKECMATLYIIDTSSLKKKDM